MANSLSTTYAFCRTEKFADVAKVNVQQSDYEHAWEVEEAQIGEMNDSMLNWGRNFFRDTFFGDVVTLGYRTWFARTGITRFNLYLTRVTIDSLI